MLILSIQFPISFHKVSHPISHVVHETWMGQMLKITFRKKIWYETGITYGLISDKRTVLCFLYWYLHFSLSTVQPRDDLLVTVFLNLEIGLFPCQEISSGSTLCFHQDFLLLKENPLKPPQDCKTLRCTSGYSNNNNRSFQCSYVWNTTPSGWHSSFFLHHKY